MIVIRDKDILHTLTHDLGGQKRQIAFFFKKDTFDLFSAPLLENDVLKKTGMYYSFLYVPKGSENFFFFKKCFLKVYDPTKKKLTFGYTPDQLEVVTLSKVNFLKYKFLSLCD